MSSDVLIAVIATDSCDTAIPITDAPIDVILLLITDVPIAVIATGQ